MSLIMIKSLRYRDKLTIKSSLCVRNSKEPRRAWDSEAYVLVSWGWCKRISSVGYFKQQKCISCTSGHWVVQGLGASRLRSWWGPSSWFADSHLLTESPQGLSLVHGRAQRDRSPFLFFYFFPSSSFFFLFIIFVIHWNVTAMGLHVFPIPIPPPTSLSTWSL